MKAYRKELHFHFPTRRGLENITEKVQAAVTESGIKEGMVLVNAMNITSSVFINDDETGLHHDLEVWLERLAPEKPYNQYRHNGYEDNADAHLKRTVMGREVVVAVTEGKLDFGTWEQIFYFEFDGKRDKRALIKVIGIEEEEI
ncbi:MAG: YjbQ family protein [Lachnospiraceae bacterium]|jgi:secondary thiamine-phosphate synthase enzyme|nr:YjbQ family protein [Lachnospiraceae bacterium]